MGRREGPGARAQSLHNPERPGFPGGRVAAVHSSRRRGLGAPVLSGSTALGKPVSLTHHSLSDRLGLKRLSWGGGRTTRTASDDVREWRSAFGRGRVTATTRPPSSVAGSARGQRKVLGLGLRWPLASATLSLWASAAPGAQHPPSLRWTLPHTGPHPPQTGALLLGQGAATG